MTSDLCPNLTYRHFAVVQSFAPSSPGPHMIPRIFTHSLAIPAEHLPSCGHLSPVAIRLPPPPPPIQPLPEFKSPHFAIVRSFAPCTYMSPRTFTPPWPSRTSNSCKELDPRTLLRPLKCLAVELMPAPVIYHARSFSARTSSSGRSFVLHLHICRPDVYLLQGPVRRPDNCAAS